MMKWPMESSTIWFKCPAVQFKPVICLSDLSYFLMPSIVLTTYYRLLKFEIKFSLCYMFYVCANCRYCHLTCHCNNWQSTGLTCSEMTIGNTTIHYWIYYYANWDPNGKAFKQFFKRRHQTLKCDLWPAAKERIPLQRSMTRPNIITNVLISAAWNTISVDFKPPLYY